MKTLLIISFDVIRSHDLCTNYSIACLLAYLQNNSNYGKEFTAEMCSLDVKDAFKHGTEYVISILQEKWAATSKNFIAFACAVWSEALICPVIAGLRQAGFTGMIILGGYQINGLQNITEMSNKYPDAQIFIRGFGEASLLRAIQENFSQYPVLLSDIPDFAKLPSPYLTHALLIPEGTQMIRWETKRGCPYQCSFCSYRGVVHQGIYRLPLHRIYSELALFSEKKIKSGHSVQLVFENFY